MKKFFFLLFSFFILESYTLSQTKYLIYFKDKGISSQALLLKSSPQYFEAVKQLSEKSIERRKKVMGENFVTYEDIPIEEKYIKKLEGHSIKIIHKLKWFNAVSAYLSEKELTDIHKLPFVKEISPVKIIPFVNDQIIPNDSFEEKDIAPQQRKLNKGHSYDYGPSFAQYNLSGIPQIHDMGINGQGVIIGILDAGFRWKDHPALKNLNVIAERDFVQGDSVTANQPGDIAGQDSHGTGVFSILAGFDPGYIVGPAFGASFILAKTENIASETHIEEDNYAAAIEWMEGLGVDITTGSLGYSEFDPGEKSYTYQDMNGNTTIVTQACNLAFERGVVTFAAAGNEGTSKWHYITAPADAYKILAVGSVNPDGTKASFSSFGPTSDGRIKPEIVAQGTSDYHAVSGGGYSFGSGTSYSCPIAAGIGSMVLSAFPYLTNEQVRQILIQTANNSSSPNNEIGYGLVSALNAITSPNLSFENNVYTVHKIFPDTLNLKAQPVKIIYSGSDGIVNEAECSFDGALEYKFSFPQYPNGEEINFLFTYKNSNGFSITEPPNGSYSFVYGKLNIDIAGPIPVNFVLYQNFPNPFNSKTRIEFSSPGNSFVNIIIYNILGQKIKELFSGNAHKGRNIVYWDGKTDFNVSASSGVYFYTLETSSTFIVKKMLYLR